MPTAPTLVAAAVSFGSGAASRTIPSITLQPGDVVVFTGTGEGGTSGASFSAPSTTFPTVDGITQLELHAAASDCQGGAWTFTVAGTGPQTGTVTLTQTVTTTNYFELGVVAARGGVQPTTALSVLQTGSGRTISYAASAADSLMVCAIGDWGANTVQSMVPTPTSHSTSSPGPSAIPESLRVTGRYTRYFGVLDDQPSTSAVNYGIGGSGTGPYTIILVEIPAATGTGGTDLTATPADSLPLTDSAGQVADRVRSQADPLALTDSATPTAARPRSQADPLDLTDAPASVADRSRSVAEPLGLTDAVTVERSGANAANPADALGLSDGLTVAWDRAATISDGLNLTDPTQPLDRATATADPLGLTDNATATRSGAGTANQADTLGLTDAVTALWTRVATVDDLLDLTDTASGSQANDATKAPTDPLPLTDAPTWTASRDRAPADGLGLSDSVVAVLERVVTIADDLTLADAATRQQQGAADGIPVPDPRLTLTVPASTLTLTVPPSTLALTVPPSRLELDVSDFTVGDTAPALTGTLNADLTGATVELHIRKPDGTVVTKAADVTDAATGTWSYEWVAGDLDQKGVWLAEAQATYSGGGVQTFAESPKGIAVKFSVREQIA